MACFVWLRGLRGPSAEIWRDHDKIYRKRSEDRLLAVRELTEAEAQEPLKAPEAEVLHSIGDRELGACSANHTGAPHAYRDTIRPREPSWLPMPELRVPSPHVRGAVLGTASRRDDKTRRP